MVKQRRQGVLAQGPSRSSILKVQVRNYSIGASNPRHDQEWRVWEDVELLEGKVLIRGVVGHASDLIEHLSQSQSDWQNMQAGGPEKRDPRDRLWLGYEGARSAEYSNSTAVGPAPALMAWFAQLGRAG